MIRSMSFRLLIFVMSDVKQDQNQWLSAPVHTLEDKTPAAPAIELVAMPL